MYIITPTVDSTQEFIEIANDFSNPLDVVREGISNAFDAKVDGKDLIIDISFQMIKKQGRDILEIKISDNGKGMTRDELQSFFDLGNSTKRNDPNTIGEKGHGTKVYFNSNHITVITKNNGTKYIAIMEEPFGNLIDRKIPEVKVEEEKINNIESGTEIVILGYNNNHRSKFTQEILKDYIIWFTKFGSIERIFNINDNKNTVLNLKGLNSQTSEKINFGHYFPDESGNVSSLFDTYLTRAPDYYCKRFIKEGSLENSPEISYQAVFYIEGNKVKQNYNTMLRRSGYQAPKGAYTVQDRYGVWLSKDYMPIERKNEWITYKGSEYTKFHAFINCQNLRLTANRGSVANTPEYILSDLEKEVKKIFNQINESEDWTQLSWLEDEADAYRTAEKERIDFQWRIRKVNSANIAEYKGITIIQPERESGVYSIVLQLLTVNSDVFPFQIIDYDTHSGIDVIVKGDKRTPIQNSKLFYVEFKYYLTNSFNHSFQNLKCIICWDTEIKHDDIVIDINKEERKMQIIAKDDSNESYTKYFLDNPRKADKIEVFVLKDYLKEKLSIDFRPRTSDSLV